MKISIDNQYGFFDIDNPYWEPLKSYNNLFIYAQYRSHQGLSQPTIFTHRVTFAQAE